MAWFSNVVVVVGRSRAVINKVFKFFMDFRQGEWKLSIQIDQKLVQNVK